MSGKGSGRRNEDSQKVRDNWGAIRWDREAETKKNQELRARVDDMPIGHIHRATIVTSPVLKVCGACKHRDTEYEPSQCLNWDVTKQLSQGANLFCSEDFGCSLWEKK